MVTVCPSQFATRRTLFHVLVGCGLLMLKVSRLKLPVIWLLVSMWLNKIGRASCRERVEMPGGAVAVTKQRKAGEGRPSVVTDARRVREAQRRSGGEDRQI